MSDPPSEPPQWFRDYQNQQALVDNQKAILARVDGLQDTLNKIIIAIAAVGGSDIGLKFVHSTPAEIMLAAIGGFLTVFSLGTLFFRYRKLPFTFRTLMLLNTVIGASLLAVLAIPVLSLGLIFSASVILLLFFLIVISWNVDKWLVKK